MKASELIERLQAFTAEHGDLPLVIRDYATGALIGADLEPRVIKPSRFDGVDSVPSLILMECR